MNVRIFCISVLLALSSLASTFAGTAKLRGSFDIPHRGRNTLYFSARDGRAEGGLAFADKKRTKVYALSGRVLPIAPAPDGNVRYRIVLRVDNGTIIRGMFWTEVRPLDEFSAQAVRVFEGNISTPWLFHQKRHHFRLEEVFAGIVS